MQVSSIKQDEVAEAAKRLKAAHSALRREWLARQTDTLSVKERLLRAKHQKAA